MRRRLSLPITLSVVLMTFNVMLMVCWIVLLAQLNSWGALTIGTIVFALILVGLIVYLVITIKEVRLNQRQVNFVDSVTHELKSPIASLRLYLETLEMRDLDAKQRESFYRVMESELLRLDSLINQLLEVGRLDAIGHRSEPEDVPLLPLLKRCAETACAHHKCTEAEVFKFDVEPAVIRARPMVLEMIFGNLLDIRPLLHRSTSRSASGSGTASSPASATTAPECRRKCAKRFSKCSIAAATNSNEPKKEPVSDCTLSARWCYC
jgi:signal transduction histidine kinase